MAALSRADVNHNRRPSCHCRHSSQPPHLPVVASQSYDANKQALVREASVDEIEQAQLSGQGQQPAPHLPAHYSHACHKTHAGDCVKPR